MKYMFISILMCVVLSGTIEAVENFLGSTEPSEDLLLNAPLHPEAVFIRTLPCLDPYFERALYVVPDPVSDVKNFFSEKLPGKRIVQYKERDAWVWTYLLKDGTPIPDNPSRDDITILDRSPNIQVTKFQEEFYDPLFELLEAKDGAQKELEVLKKARTVIRYTYEKPEENIEFQKIIGTWRNVDRDLLYYSGSVLHFYPDSTYTLTLTTDNISYLVSFLSSTQEFKGLSTDDITAYIENRTPEKGKFTINRTMISMETDLPVVGEKEKSGLAEIGSVSLSLRFINIPRLTFIRVTSE